MATYTRFSSDDVVITTEKVFTSTWTGNTNALTTSLPTHFGIPGNIAATNALYASPSGNLAFATSVYNGPAATTTNEVQYTISYGHKAGSGSLDYTSTDPGFSSARSIYGQYRSLIYGDENRNFTFNGYEPQDIYVININRARYKQSLRLGSLDLHLKGPVKLTDDSVTRSGSAVLTNIGRQFNVVSGSAGIMLGSNLSQANADSGSYGLFYPDAGIIILNPDALRRGSAITALPTRTGNLAFGARDNVGLLTASIIDTDARNFELDSQENISSQFYFVRAKNKEFNYTTNASFIDANGNINLTSMVDNPVSYITTVGLYNDANELLAVAKLSQPITKDFTKEALIKVTLDY